MLVQVTPGNTRSRNPEYPIQNKPMVPWPPPATCATLNHKGLKTGPFLIIHQTAQHDSFPKSYLESDTTRFGNPLCQQLLGSGLIDQSQKVTVAAMQMADMKVCAQRS